MLRAEEAEEWLLVAAEDLRMADLALAASPPIIGLGLYHAQQAVEKALKGFLVFHGVRYPITHNLAALLRACIPLDPTLEAGVLPTLPLTDFATRFRYPGEFDQPSLEEAKRWLALGRGVV